MKRVQSLLAVLLIAITQQTLSQPGAFNLNSPTNGAWANATPLFSWSSSSGSTYYRLYVDGVLKKDSIPSSTTQYQLTQPEAINEALHTWYVRARNSSGQETQSTQTWSVRIDATPPSVFDLTNPSDNTWANDNPFNYSWLASSDAASGLRRYELQVDSLSLATATPSATSINSAFVPFVSAGNHTWRVMAVDSVGNTRYSTSFRRIRFDYSPPEGLINPALTLGGSSSYFSVPNDSSLRPANRITLEAWINFETGGTAEPNIITSVAIINGLLRGVSITLTNNTSTRQVGFRVGSNYLGEIRSLSAGTWYHIACVYDGSAMRIYVNGVLDNSAPRTGTISYYSNGFVAGAPQPDRGAGGFYKGKIDEIRVWQIARTQDQIRLTMQRPLVGTEFGLVGYWRFNESSGTTVWDISRRGNWGSLVSGATLAPSTLLGNGVAPVTLIRPPDYQYVGTISPAFVWGRTADAGIGFQKYQLWVDGVLKQDNLTDTSLVFGPLAYSYHSWYVRTLDQLGNSQEPYPANFYVDNVPPSSFNLLAPSDSQVVAIPTPTFSWQGTADSALGSGLRKYQLWVDGSVNIDSIPVGTTSTSPSAPLLESPHAWHVKAYDNVGNVRQSNQSRTVFVDFNPPSTFSLVSPANGSTVNESRPRFAWRKSVDIGSGIARYVLNISGRTPLNVPPTDTSTQVPTAMTNGTYTWFVLAYDRGNSLRSSDTSTVTINVLPPVAPVLSAPSHGATNQPTTLVLNWNASNGADTYHLQVATDTSFVSLVRNDSVISATSSSVGPLANGTSYHWRARAKNTAGVSAWSMRWTFRTVPTLPLPVTLVSPNHAATIGADSAKLVWRVGQPEITRYWLEWGTDSLFAIANRDSTLIDTAAVARTLVHNQTYWWRVKGRNAAEWGTSWSEHRRFRVFITGVESIEGLPSEFFLEQNYPNPFNPSTNFRYGLPRASKVSLKVYDALGQLVRVLVDGYVEAGYHEIKFTVRGSSSGVYFYCLHAGEFIQTRKLVILR